MPGFGVSFAPGTEDPNELKGRTPQEQYQQAIRVLSLRLPKIVGGSPLAPAPLLNAPGSGGMPMGPVGQPQPGNPGSLPEAYRGLAGLPPAPTPAPRVSPGLDPIPTGAPLPPARTWQPAPEAPISEHGPITPRQDFPADWLEEIFRRKGAPGGATGSVMP